MKMSKKKTEVAVILLVLLAFVMVYVTTSILSFLGIWMLIGIVYWDKKRHERKGKRTVMLMLLCFSVLLLSTFSTPLVYATVIQDHEKSNILIYPVHHLYVAIDTDADTINIVWEGCDVLITPVIALRNPLTPAWKVSDSKGFLAYRNCFDNGSLPHTGSDTIEGYTNLQTWLTVEVEWSYFNGIVLVIVDLEVKLYISNPDSGGGGGGGGGGWFFVPE